MYSRIITIPEIKYKLPIIADYEILLDGIIPNTGITTSKEYCLRKNIAYNLQYMQYLKTNIEGNFFSDKGGSIHKLNMKTYIIIASSIIECLLYYLLLKNNKLNTEEIKKIKYNKIINKCKGYHLLGNKECSEGEDIYKKLDYVRGLRNKIHLHIGSTNIDHDFNSFNYEEYKKSKKIIKYIVIILCNKINKRNEQDRTFLKIFA